ncbi:hypothetical protein CAOG_06530 [Capsaspora owczarzaki ATCC 30864]|uniref:Uncharacterized protein n=1 Tax=Capsaspora owczarzaki (strain ATCC 30864) TaxID=595528 RepID=A0A0D2X4J5_CAPO3|nr:hypothetical protein CAOG_06530 [Capsaspora owczarzaki ATCC 30864]KJE96169.1 hypothetical protein CAOG_006530 [Capsaspora owczarzaki ATCC 30864]|eukprot:XP_004345279.1 hypothetical protein CAOG_06530 [Capsaspora owczarzaki ATCC 30864]
MGAGARRRKLKSVDPFNTKSNRALTQDEIEAKTKVNLSRKAETAIPRSVKRIMAMNDEIKRTGTYNGRHVMDEGDLPSRSKSDSPNRSHKPPAATATRTPSSNRTEPQVAKQNASLRNMKRMDGESMSDFSRRVDAAAQPQLSRSMLSSHKTREKRKEHLEKRRAKAMGHDMEMDHQGRPIREFSSMKDNVKFGEVVMQPPRLTAKPKTKVEVKKQPLLLEQILSRKAHAGDDATVTAQPTKRKDMTPAAKARLDAERERAIALYRQMRKGGNTYVAPSLPSLSMG